MDVMLRKEDFGAAGASYKALIRVRRRMEVSLFSRAMARSVMIILMLHMLLRTCKQVLLLMPALKGC